MNRSPFWKYLIVLAALLIGLIYTLPNLFGESPAVQVAGAKSVVKIDLDTLKRVESLLGEHQIPTTGAYFEQNRSEEHTSELQSRGHLVCRLLLEKKKISKWKKVT